MNTLEYIIKKFNPESNGALPIKLTNINRTIMAETLGELGFTIGAEVGVAEGMHAEVLFKNIPELELSLIDVYEKYPGYEEYKDPEACFKEAQERVTGYGAFFHKGYSMDEVKKCPDYSLDFVYIDGAHDFKNVTMDVCEWSKKVKVGGIVFGHDFKRSKRNVVDVKDVIPAFCYAKNISPWFELSNDLKDPTFGHDNPGWMFVRQETDKL